MAHELYIDLKGKASMAYVNDEPWHGLGQKLTEGASLETWSHEAGLDYAIQDSPVFFHGLDGSKQIFDNKKALYRNDTGAALGMVSDRYRVVQPVEVLEFFRDLTEAGGYQLETAGSMFGGAQYWALAKTGHSAHIGGKKAKDDINGYLLLATGCDGKLATTAQFTSIRVVCNNTLTAALRGQNKKDNSQVKVTHRSQFDASKVKQELGLDTIWNDFIHGVEQLADTPIKDEQALQFIVSLVGDPEKDFAQQQEKAKDVATVWQLYKGKGRGSELATSANTAWGLVNAITEHVDHLSGSNIDTRLRSAWHYDLSYLKNEAYQRALVELTV
jgi:phage/plasmid-like protein (TIGR03299 family)